jgi:putative transposase
VANRPIYTAVAVTTEGEREVLGLWAGDGGEGAKFWLGVLTEIKNRGVDDVCIVVCDGLKGLPDAIGNTWPLAVTQTCVLHLVRHTFRLAGRQHWDQVAKALRPIYTAPTEAAAKERLSEFTATWGERYPAIVRLWENAWAEFTPFLAFEVEVRKVIFSSHFPSDQAALKCLYLTLRSLDPTGRGRQRWAIRWKPALNAFALMFEGRIIPNQ